MSFILIVSFSVSADVTDSEGYNSAWRISIDNDLRLYNAFLHGQFRHSEVVISGDQLERLVAEYWRGGAYVFAGLYTASIFVRGHSEEFKGPNARSVSWIGLMFSRSY